MSGKSSSFGFGLSPKQDPPGPPFSSNAANNGLSVDPVTGEIVLGNDSDFLPSGTAQLISQRKIYLNGQALHLLDDPGGLGNEVDVAFSAGSINITALGAGGSANLTASVGAAGQLFLSSAGFAGLNPVVQFDVGGVGTYNLINISGALRVMDTAVSSFLLIDAPNDIYQLGDISTRTTGTNFLIDAGSGRIEFNGGGSRVMELLPLTHIAQFGDIDSVGAGLILKVDAFTQLLDLRNTALTAAYSCNGQPGFTGTVTPVTSITVEGGIVTAAS